MKIANRIDVDRLKQNISIVDLVGQSFDVVGSGHTLTTREHDSLKLFTNNNSWTWFSQQGPKSGPLGGSVIDWYMHVHKCDYRAAITALSAMIDRGTVAAMPKPKPTVSQQPKAETWRSERWQADKRQMIAQSRERLLNSREGKLARDYLAGRGIRSDIWSAFNLGYAVVNNPNVGKKMGAVVMPWLNKSITALEFRFLDVDKKERFSTWGNRYLFGLPRTQGRDRIRPGRSNTLMFIEGPLNAVSVYQAAYRNFGLDVVSFGSQSYLKTPAVAGAIKALARGYPNLLVWSDIANVARGALDILPGAYLIKSPNDIDANDMLRGGYLVEFLDEILSRQTKGMYE